LLARHGLAQLVRKDEGRLVLAVEIAAQLERRNPLGAVHEDYDGGQEIGEAHLARGEDRAASDAELVMASNALELAARRDVVRLDASRSAGQIASPSFSGQRISQNVR